MKSSKNQKTEKNLSDVNSHLDELELGIETLQLDYNREKSIYLFCDNAITKLSIIKKLIQKSRLSIALFLISAVNKLFLEDENLSIVNVQIVNSKRLFNPSAIANLKITL